MVAQPGVELVEAVAEAQEVLAEAVEGNRVDLRPFTNAVFPGRRPEPYPLDAEGWSEIDGWDVWECSASLILPMEEVPGPFRNVWGTALATVLRRVNLALAGGDQVEV